MMVNMAGDIQAEIKESQNIEDTSTRMNAERDYLMEG
jgi:hypothetical protein